MSALFQEILALPLDQRIKLAEDLWENIESEIEHQPVPQWQLSELRRRYARFEEDRKRGRPWAEVYKELQAEYGGADSASGGSA